MSKYVRNMEGLIDGAREHFTEKILCSGLAPIDQSKSVPFILERTASFHSADQLEYDLALETVCRRRGVRSVSLGNLMLEDYLSEDGVHPLSSGHAIIAETVLKALGQLSQARQRSPRHGRK